jgi:cytoplasmic iron level regulating protein YaaA (DUF328/UPF0246 family)
LLSRLQIWPARLPSFLATTWAGHVRLGHSVFFSMGIAVLSPAKTLDESPCPERTSGSDHPFAGRTATLLEICKRLSKAQLKGLMGLSDALAKLNFDRFQAFEVSPMPRGTILVQSWQPTGCGRCAQAQAAKASAWAFDGPAHKAWAIDTLGKMEQEYAQSHVLTLSGLYGCLRPRDAIRPCALTAARPPAASARRFTCTCLRIPRYRLEMGTKLETDAGSTLYAFWGSIIADEIVSRLGAMPRTPADRRWTALMVGSFSLFA